MKKIQANPASEKPNPNNYSRATSNHQQTHQNEIATNNMAHRDKDTNKAHRDKDTNMAHCDKDNNMAHCDKDTNMAHCSDPAQSLKSLGKKTAFTFEYDKSLLESFENQFDNDYFIRFNCPEFTSVCPITGQPDFATIYINYIADKRCVESKSLKLYLNSFRNHGGFHETCVNMIMLDLIELLEPRYIEVLGEFLPRGGISIDPYANHGKGEKYQKMAEYRLQNHDLIIKKVDNR